MSDHITHIEALSPDAAWLHDWAAEGIAALERYLAAHARFDAYLRARETR